MNRKGGIAERIRSFWSKEEHAGASCDYCRKTRAEAKALVASDSHYICDECVMIAFGVVLDRIYTVPHEAAFEALASVADPLPKDVAYAQLTPLLDAMIGLQRGRAAAVRTSNVAYRHGHEAYALKALEAVPAEERTVTTWHNIAAFALSLGMWEVARDALDSAAALPAGRDLYHACHRALLAAGTEAWLTDDEVAVLLARVRTHDDPRLRAEALEAAARHRAYRGDVRGALGLVDGGLADLPTSAPMLLLRGDLLAPDDRAAAETAWRAVLDSSHAESVDASRARERLKRRDPYRSPA